MALSSTVFCDTCGAANRAQAAFCSACGRPLHNAAMGAISRTLTGLLTQQHMLKQRYRILSQIGKGGFGAVYKAADTQFGNRLLAIKEMSQSSLTSRELTAAIESFKREAYLLAGLTHPNLPRIYEQFNDAGRWYLVMDYIDGETLETYLDKVGGKLPIEKALNIGIQLCSVLDYLHTRQPAIIFRDLKPANIMLAPDGHIFLIDFGIARHFKPGQARDTAYYGSMGYAPPEQYGKAQTTPRSDIYSLGVVLYQLFSGHDPSSSPFRFPPLQSLVPTVPTNLATLITQMLELDEDKRPANMAAVKQKLEQIADQRRYPPVPPPPPVPPINPAPLPPPVSQNKGVSWRGVIIGLIVLVVVGVFGLVVSHSPSPTPQLPTPTQPPSPNYSATATATTGASTPSVTWLVTYDYYENALALKNGYQVNDPVNHHFIVVHLTSTNNTSQAQELQTGQDFYLQGSDGQRYYEDQASNPSNILQFAPGETQHVYTAYVVPDSVCNYTLVVANPGGQDLTWSITVTDSNYCHA